MSPVNKDHRVGLKLCVVLGVKTPSLEEASSPASLLVSLWELSWDSGCAGLMLC